MPVLENTTIESEIERFEMDMEWIYNHYETLKRQYPNEFVAVLHQAVVVHDADIEGLMANLKPQQRLGDLAIKFIYAEPPNIVLTPSLP